jgi:hypothetical protein
VGRPLFSFFSTPSASALFNVLLIPLAMSTHCTARWRAQILFLDPVDTVLCRH